MDYSQQCLGKKVTVTVDRQMNSTHPKHGFIYPVNYGYIEGVIAPDSEELDAYILGVDQPLEKFERVYIAIIHRTDDDDDKLVVAPEGRDFTDEQIRELTNFQEQYFKSKIMRVG